MIAGILSGLIILLLVSSILVYFVLMRKKRNLGVKEEKEEMDKNPDYGETSVTAEYQETAVKDINMYYGLEDGDYDAIDNLSIHSNTIDT